MKSYLLILVLLSIPVVSVSLTAPLQSNELLFEPGKEVQLTYVVKNGQSGAAAVEVNVDSRKLPFPVHVSGVRRLLQGGENVAVNVSFTFPQFLSSGVYDLLFTANDVVDTAAGMSAIAGAGNAISIISTYKDSFLTGGIIAREKYAPGELIELRLNVRNLGVKNVQDVFAKAFLVVNGVERKVKEESLGSLGSLATQRFMVDIPTSGLPKGVHLLKVVLSGDGTDYVVLKEFMLGVPVFSVLGNSGLRAGEENAVAFNVSSDWNVPIKNATFRVVTSRNLFAAETTADLLPGSNEVVLTGIVGKSADEVINAEFLVLGTDYLVKDDFNVQVEGDFLTSWVVRRSSADETAVQKTGVSVVFVAALVLFAGFGAFIAGRLFSRRSSQ